MEKETLQEGETRVTEVTNVAESGKRKLELAACEGLPCEIMESVRYFGSSIGES